MRGLTIVHHRVHSITLDIKYKYVVDYCAILLDQGIPRPRPSLVSMQTADEHKKHRKSKLKEKKKNQEKYRPEDARERNPKVIPRYTVYAYFFVVGVLDGVT